MKQILKDIWSATARANPKDKTACRFQTMLVDSLADIYACSRGVYYDYAPTEKLELNKHYAVDDLPFKKLQDPEKVLAESMFYPGAIPLTDNSTLEALFLNDGPCKANHELAVFDRKGNTACFRGGLPWGDATYFEWVRKVLFFIPDEVRWRVQKSVTLKELNAQLVRLKTSPDIALLLGSATSWLLVPMSRISNSSELNENLFIDGCQFRLDGWNNESRTYSRLVEVVSKTMRGLANPTKAAKQTAQAAPPPAPAAPTEPEMPPAQLIEEPVPQVEEVQPELAEEIAEQAPEATAPVPEHQLIEPQEDEAPKRTRTRKAPTAATPANAKALEEVAAYLGSPVADSMTMEEIDEEIRKCRDLGVVLSRRMANLYAAGTLIPKKKLAAVREAMN